MLSRNELIEEFEHAFGPGGEIGCFFAPCRVNLIGEHIDYNGGLVFPAAMTMKNVAAVRKRNDRIIRLATDTIPGAMVAFPIDQLELFRGKSWGAYQLGVAYEMERAGYALSGCDMYFTGNVPFGSGLSSSASLEVVTALALAVLSGVGSPDMPQLAVLSQKAENNYVGLNCGIMDQFIVANGKADHAMLLDCETLAFEHVPLHLEGYRVVATNSNKHRSLNDTAYNTRRSQCAQALSDLRERIPDLKNLCALTPEEFEILKGTLSDPSLVPIVRHAVTENQRVLDSAEALKNGDLAAFGRLLVASHESLRDDYDITGKEIDALNDAALAAPGVIGSRMTGGGGGGCIVSIVKEEKIEEFRDSVAKEYTDKTGLIPSFYVSDIGDGAGRGYGEE